MSATSSSASNDEVSETTTGTRTTANMTARTLQEPQFIPTVFNIHVAGKQPHHVMPYRLIRGVHRTSATVEYLSLEKFWHVIERELGFKRATHRLFVHVPGTCGGKDYTVDVRDKKVWYVQLQRCHNAGQTEVKFDIRERAASNDHVHVAASTAVSQLVSCGPVLGGLVVLLVVLVVLARAHGTYLVASYHGPDAW